MPRGVSCHAQGRLARFGLRRPRLPRNPKQSTAPAPVRTGRRVILRHPVASDRAEFVALRRSSRAHLAPWEPHPPAGFDPWGDDAFDRLLATCTTATDMRLLVVERATSRLAGLISISGIVRGPLQSAYVGYWIGSSFAGRGLMTEALALAVRYAFQSLRLHRVEANIQPHNSPSRRLVRRLGFRREGFSPRYLKIAGRWTDHERWAITLEDFTRLRRDSSKKTLPR